MIQAIIIDDEHASAELLAIKLKKAAPDIFITGIYSSSADGLNAIEQEQPQVLFIDIEMPGLDGISLVKKMDTENTEVIFVTAFDQYAIEAVRLQALDYLLKPVGEEQLNACILRLREKLAEKEKIKTSFTLDNMLQKMQTLNMEYNKIAIATMEGILFIPVKDIVRVESESNYSTLFLLGGKKIVVSKTLRIIEEMLAPYRFFRPHKSHLINLQYIIKYIKGEGGMIVLADGSQVEVSRQRKADFLKVFGDK